MTISRRTGIATFPDPSAGPIYRQIYDAYRDAILDGRLAAGQRVPATRALAEQLGISRQPVLNAFDQLLHEGYFEGRVGSGTFVAASIGRDAMSHRERLDRASSGEQVTERVLPGGLRAFRVSLPALDHFPLKTWSRIVSRRSRRMTPTTMDYGDPAGSLELRSAITDHLRAARGVDCDASQVLIVSGSQMALQLCARVLLARGDVCGMEEPGYDGARQALGTTGATLKAIPVDGDGLVVKVLEGSKTPPRCVYVTPSHQYPLGVSMHAARRLALLEWAARAGAWILEDDYDSDYRYSSRPLPSLQGMDRASRVIYIGTFSKVLFPALRVGYIIAPPSLVKPISEARRAIDLFSPMLSQLALADFMREGHYGRHVRRMRALYMSRRDALVEAIEQRLHGELGIVTTDAGMHLAALLDPHVDDKAVVAAASVRGVSAIALSSCYAGKAARSGLVLGFGGAEEAELTRAVGILRTVIMTLNKPRNSQSRLP